MLYATIWRDLRWRFVAALLVLLTPVALVTTSLALQPRAETIGRSYAQLLDEGWFRLPGPSAVFLLIAVITSAGGRLLRPRGDVAYLFALPISRRRWLLAHAALSIAAIAVLAILVDVAFGVAAWHRGDGVPVTAIALRTLGVVIASAAWVGVTLGVLSVVRYPVLAMTIVLGALEALPGGRFQLQIPVKAASRTLSMWDPWMFADPRSWQGGVPLVSLAMTIALGAVGIGLALFRIERIDV